VICDAQDTLAQLMVAGQPDWERFEKVIRGAMRKVRPAFAVQFKLTAIKRTTTKSIVPCLQTASESEKLRSGHFSRT
jgi:hypothetical protein